MRLKAKFDGSFIYDVLSDLHGESEGLPGYQEVQRTYKIITGKIIRKFEIQLLKTVPKETKLMHFREISRIFREEDIAEQFKKKQRRIANWRLEELKRDKVSG